MPALTFYRMDGACSIAAHMLLRELNLDFEDIAMRKGPEGLEPIHKSRSRSEFMLQNPTGYVPVLVVDGTTVLTELSAILTYIASISNSQHAGRDDLEKAEILAWMSWLSITLNEYGFAGVWAPHRMVDSDVSPEVVAALKAGGLRTIKQAFRTIDERIGNRDHPLSNRYTVVDFMLHTFWRWGVLAEVDMNIYPNYERVARGVERLTSVRMVLRVEGVPLSFPEAVSGC